MKSYQTQILSNFPPPNPTAACASTPASNTTLDSGDTGAGGGIAIETTTVYYADGTPSRLLIYDVTNPGSMSKIGDQTLNSGAFAQNQPGTQAIGVLNKIAYIASYPSAANCYLGVYDCTVPGAVSQLGTFLLGVLSGDGTNAKRVGVSVVGADKFCFVAFSDTINIIKVTNPAAMVSVATVTVPDVAGNGTDALFLFQNVLYATTIGLHSHDFRAKAWNVSVPSAPALLWDTAIPGDVFTLPDIYAVNQGGGPIAVVVIQGNVGRGGIQLVDGNSGALLGSLVLTTNSVDASSQVWVNPLGSCAELALGGAASLRLIDISNTAAPAVRSSLGMSGQYDSVVGLSNGSPTNVFVGGIVGGGNFSIKIESINV